MAAAHQIVIIGASFGGLGAAHGLLKDVLPGLSAGGKQSYKVVQIAPHAEFYWKIGAPRTIVNPKALPVEKALIPIEPHFKKYQPEQYEFIVASVTSIDPSTKTLHLSTSATVHYDSLVIASGTSFTTPLWSISDGVEELRAALKDIHERLPGAHSVLIAGGGAVGVETAGELGETYGKTKEITLLSGQQNLLPRLHNKKIGQDAQSRLTKMGVKVVNDNVRVTSHTKTEDGKEVLQLSNGETKTVDVYIPATGDQPNSKFVPQEWLDDKNQVKTDAQTLRLSVPDVTGVYSIGTVSSYSDGTILDVKFALPALLESIKLDLQGQSKATLVHF